MGHTGGSGRQRRRLAVAVAAASTVVLAGCGGGGLVNSGSEPGRGAAFIPAGAPVYLEMSTDLSSPQWSMARDIAARFPGYEKLIGEAKASMAKDGVDFERDIRPILGEDAALAITDFNVARNSDPRYVAAIDIADGKDDAVRRLITEDGKATAAGEYQGVTLYRQDGGSSYAAVVDGAVLIADSEESTRGAIDAHRAGDSRTMAGSKRLREAFAGLPDEVLVQGFMDIGSVIKTVERQRGGGSADLTKQLESFGLGSDSSVAISLSTEQDGLRIKAVGTALGKPQQGTSYTPKLVERASAEAIGLIGFDNSFEVARLAFEQAAASDPKVRDQLASVRGALALIGLSVDDLKLLFSGEQMVVVEPRAQFPAIVGAFTVDDGAKARTILDRVRTTVSAFLAQQAKIPAFTEVQLARGVSGWESKVDPKASVVYGVDGNLAIIGSDVEAVKRFQEPGSRLTDDPAYQAATDQMPGKVQSIVWINVAKVLDLVQANGGFGPGDAETLANLRPIRNVAAWSTGGEHPTFEAFVTVR